MAFPELTPYVADRSIIRDKAAKLANLELSNDMIDEYAKQCMNTAFIETNKTNWLTTDFGYSTLKSAIEDLAVAEALKDRPLLVEVWKSFVDEGLRKLKSILKNPSITATNPPSNVTTVGRDWNTRGMNTKKNWYFSLAVDGREGDSESSYANETTGSNTIESFP